jgi:hypothetical protein
MQQNEYGQMYVSISRHINSLCRRETREQVLTFVTSRGSDIVSATQLASAPSANIRKLPSDVFFCMPIVDGVASDIAQIRYDGKSNEVAIYGGKKATLHAIMTVYTTLYNSV